MVGINEASSLIELSGTWLIGEVWGASVQGTNTGTYLIGFSIVGPHSEHLFSEFDLELL